MIDFELAQKIVDYLNDLLDHDRPAIAALVVNRVPCNEELADHPTCQAGQQHGGYYFGFLGVLNGLCGVDEMGFGPVIAVFDDPENEGEKVKRWLDLVRFRVRDTLLEKKENNATEE